jgi:Icc-related predicted phosphoesterase
MIRITAIGCLHGAQPELPGGDLLLITGDLTASCRRDELDLFLTWARLQPYERIIYIAGNHDNHLTNMPHSQDTLTYLCDSGTVYRGFNIWGSPWTKTFKGINPNCKAFTLDTEEQLYEKFKKIPAETHILLTHSPPFGLFDCASPKRKSLGSISLREVIYGGGDLILHVFSHIHEGGGRKMDTTLTKFANCSIMDRWYKPTHPVITFTLKEETDT